MNSKTRNWIVYPGKVAAAYVLWALGILTLWRWVALRRRVVVLAYHRVLPEGAETTSHPGIVVTPSTFEQQMRLLQRTFKIISLEEFEGHIKAGTPFEPNSCLVTFDDGWIDTYTTAWPVMRQLGIPALIFLPTNFIGSNETFWQESLGALLCRAIAACRKDASFAPRLAAVLASCALSDFLPLVAAGDSDAIIIKIRELKSDSNFEPSAAVQRIAALLGDDGETLGEGDRFMTWDHAREMSRHGITFGTHGHTHRLMTNLQPDELTSELTVSREVIGRELGIGATSMSYPNGNRNATVGERVKAERFTTGFSMQRGHFASADDAYCVPRMNVHQGITRSMPLFLARILGVF